MPRRYKIFLSFWFVFLVLDQLTKLWARTALMGHGYAGIPLIDGNWIWRLSYNTGSAFGMFAKVGGARVVLSLIALAACGFIVYYLHRAEDRQGWFAAAMGLVASGALGNALDRMFMGKVTDFVVWRVKSFEWPAFNVADAALVVGVFLLFIDSGREQKRKDAEPEADGE